MITSVNRRITSNGVDLDAVKLPKLEVLDPFEIEPLRGQIRKQFFGIAELAGSITAAGQATPIIVRELPRGSKFPYGLVDGERRLRACLLIKRGIIAVIYDGLMDLKDVHALSVAANFGRQKHDCMEIAKAIEQFRETGKKWRQIKDIFGKSSTWVQQHYNLLKLHPDIQNWLVPGAVPLGSNNPQDVEGVNSRTSLGSKRIQSRINFTTAQQLLALPQDRQIEVAKRIVNKNMSLPEARRLILQKARKLPGFRSSASPQEWRKSILSLAKKISTSVATYNDMQETEFRRIFESVPTRDLEGLIKNLENAGEEISQLSLALHRELRRK